MTSTTRRIGFPAGGRRCRPDGRRPRRPPAGLVGTAQDEPETALRQFLSGNVFGTLGLQPALGRLFIPADDVTPGGHPIAVLSYDYWSRRFNRDPA